MNYSQYKGVVERTFNKPLGTLMKELCAGEKVSAAEGAKRLGVAKEVFVHWRRQYRLEKKQLMFEAAIEELRETKNKYAKEAKAFKAAKPLQYSNEQSLRGFEEMIDRKLEELKVLHFESEGLAPKTGSIAFYEFTQTILKEYVETHKG